MPIQLRRNTKAWWESNNPIPKSGEACVEEVSSGVYRVKLGTEITPWNSLYYPFVFTVGDNSYSGVQDFCTGVVRRANIQNYAEPITPLSITNSGLSIDLTSGNVYSLSLTTNITGISITGARPSGTLHSFTLICNYIDSGRAITWPSSVYWNGGSGSAPSLSSGVGRSAIFSFSTQDGGSSYFGFNGGTNFGA